MAIFRVEKTRDFTVMSNHHLKNNNLTLKSKGLLSLILSLPEDWDYTLKGLAHICREGVDAIRAAIKELEAEGYIERHRLRNMKGQLTEIEYVIHEAPVKSEPTSEKSTLEKPMLENPTLENPMLDNPILEKPTLENPILEKPTLENPTQLNTNILNTKELKTNITNNPSINSEAELSETDWIERYNENAEIVKSNIDYESLCRSYEREIIDDIVNIMAEVLTVDKKSYTIEGCVYPTAIIQKRFREVNHSMMEILLMQLNKFSGKIHNIKAYLITTVFNAASTASAQLQNTVNNDLYGGGKVE